MRTRVAVAVVVAVVAAVAMWTVGGRGGAPMPDEPVTEFTHVHGLGIPPWASDTVFVATHRGLIRIDGEGVWRSVSREQHDFMGFAIDPTDDGVLYTSGHPAPGTGLQNPVGFMVSHDRGRTWTPRALHGETDFHAMAVQPTDGDVVYGYHGGELYRSTDAGESWVTVDEAGAVRDVGGALALAVDPDDADVVLAATENALLRLADDGRDATLLLEAPTTAVAVTGADGGRVLAFVPDPGPGLIESTDGGDSWQELGFVLDDDAVGHIAVHPDDDEVIYLGTYGSSLYRTVDGGGSWERLAEEGVPQGS